LAIQFEQAPNAFLTKNIHVLPSDIAWVTNLDYVSQAAAIAERERWPRLGLSTTRRALKSLCCRFNDEKVQCLACFICGNLRTTCEGFPQVDLDSPATGSSANVKLS
jgi:hypothetical protein